MVTFHKAETTTCHQQFRTTWISMKFWILFVSNSKPHKINSSGYATGNDLSGIALKPEVETHSSGSGEQCEVLQNYHRFQRNQPEFDDDDQQPEGTDGLYKLHYSIIDHKHIYIRTNFREMLWSYPILISGIQFYSFQMEEGPRVNFSKYANCFPKKITRGSSKEEFNPYIYTLSNCLVFRIKYPF